MEIHRKRRFKILYHNVQLHFLTDYLLYESCFLNWVRECRYTMYTLHLLCHNVYNENIIVPIFLPVNFARSLNKKGRILFFSFSSLRFTI